MYDFYVKEGKKFLVNKTWHILFRWKLRIDIFFHVAHVARYITKSKFS